MWARFSCQMLFRQTCLSSGFGSVSRSIDVVMPRIVTVDSRLNLLHQFATAADCPSLDAVWSEIQNAFGNPACFSTPFAVWRDLMALSTGKFSPLIGLYQIS